MNCLFQASLYVRDDAVASLIHLISSTTTLHTYTVQQLYKALETSTGQVSKCSHSNTMQTFEYFALRFSMLLDNNLLGSLVLVV